MKRRFQAELFVFRKGQNIVFRRVRMRSFRSVESALRQCEAWLAKHTVTTTRANYHRDVRRARAHCRVADLKMDREGKILAKMAYNGLGRLDVRVNIVPSVGELGWTP